MLVIILFKLKLYDCNYGISLELSEINLISTNFIFFIQEEQSANCIEYMEASMSKVKFSCCTGKQH